ncbi:MAG TPA: RIP metalloprotease RseP [Ignavibacteriaceae bacterium]|nr:RIP metalloprotease RseP [Ignavibacteriaceae bacterium]
MLLDYIVYFAITIGILVFVHEFGHFAAAKLSGMRADVFAIGFGKRLFGWNKITGFTFGELPKDFDGQGNTDYRISLLPLGGYVKIAGMVDESFDTEFANKKPEPYEFRSKPVHKKIFVITAGVLMNLLLAFVIFWFANFFQGKQIIDTTTIGYVEPSSTADSLGFKTGDVIISVNNVKIDNWNQLEAEMFINTMGKNVNAELRRGNKTVILNIPRSRIPEQSELPLLIPQGLKPPIIDSVLAETPAEKSGIKKGDLVVKINKDEIQTREEAVGIISKHKSESINLFVLRDKDTISLSATPDKEGKIGVLIAQNFKGKTKTETYGFFESFYYSWRDIERVTDLTFTMLGRVISGEIAFGKAFGGPIRIAEYAVKSANSGISTFIGFIALLSLTLAIINIMPFPVLDGGHLLIIIIEGVIRREIPIKVKVAIQNVGFVILLLLMAFILYNDILNI